MYDVVIVGAGPAGLFAAYELIINKPNLKAINEWLKEHIHIYGATKNPDELMNIATGMSFDASYYVEYLKNKFSKLYNL